LNARCWYDSAQACLWQCPPRACRPPWWCNAWCCTPSCATRNLYQTVKTSFATVSVSHDSVPWPALDFLAFPFGLIDHHCFDLYRHTWSIRRFSKYGRSRGGGVEVLPLSSSEYPVGFYPKTHYLENRSDRWQDRPDDVTIHAAKGSLWSRYSLW